MSDKSGIEWTDATWNPTVGCTKVSPGCDHCYAEQLVNRFAGSNSGFPNRFDDMHIRDDKHLTLPLRWRTPKRIFVNSLSDLFHDDVPDEFIARVFAVMAMAPRHTFQVLTKRHARMRSLLNDSAFRANVAASTTDDPALSGHDWSHLDRNNWWPLPNVWLGVSVENQKWADIRIPALLGTPAAVRFLSCEPLLGPVDLLHAMCVSERLGVDIDWLIVGGESGRGARPMDPRWAKSLQQQCRLWSIAFLFKQWGEHDANGERVGKKASGRQLDGRTWDEYPELVPA